MIKKEFLAFAEALKSMKADILYISPTGIYGFDTTLTVVKKLNTLFNVRECVVIKTSSLNTFVNSIKDAQEESDIWIPYVYLEPVEMKYLIQDIILKVEYMSSNGRIVHSSNLKNNENFNKIMEMKTGDGSAVLVIDNIYPITLYNNLLPVNKSDKVELDILQLDETSFLARFIITKKKNISIVVYIRYLFL